VSLVSARANLARPAERVVAFYNHLRAVHQKGQGSDQVDKAVMPFLRRQRRPPSAPCARLQSRQLHPHAGNAQDPEPWSLTSLREKLIKIGAEVVSHGRYFTFQMAEVAVSRQMFADPD
jgi:hypothetical protein